MWTGTGPREFRRVIDFDEPFSAPPVVTVGLSMLDIDQASNHRVDICAEMVTREGFVIVFRTWLWGRCATTTTGMYSHRSLEIQKRRGKNIGSYRAL